MWPPIGGRRGSATGVKQAPVGYNRAYVRAAADASLDEFYEAWKTGRNFVTNGPMLMLRAESGEQPGDTIELPKQGGSIQVHVDVFSDQPLKTLEIVVNGEVAAAFDVDGATVMTGSSKLQFAEGSWIAARCTAQDNFLDDDELAEYQDNSGNPQRRTALPGYGLPIQVRST